MSQITQQGNAIPPIMKIHHCSVALTFPNSLLFKPPPQHTLAHNPLPALLSASVPSRCSQTTASGLGGWLSRLWPVFPPREPLGPGLEWSPSGGKEKQKGQPHTNGMKAGSGHGEGLLGEAGGLRSLRVFASCSCKGRER